MSERATVIRAGGAGSRRTLVLTRPITDGITDTPQVTPGGGTPSGRVPSAGSSRAFGGSGSQRTLTVHGANACVPIYLGGPQRYGGFLIAYKRVGNLHYFDIAWGEGPLQSIDTERFGNLTAAALSITMEHHLGVAGDTTSTLMEEAIPTYTIPEYIAHTVFKCFFSDSVGDYSPMDLTVSIEGWVGYDFLNSVYAYRTRDPFFAVWEMLTNPRQGNNDPSLLSLEDFTTCTDVSTADIGAGEIRWEMSMRIDQQDTLQNHIANVLTYAFGHLRFNDGKFGCWIDWVRDRSLDNESNWIQFKDNGENQNVTDEVTVVRKGRGQIPTVATGDYSDASQQFVDASVQFPSSVSGDWREQRYSMPGITLRSRMLRWLQTAFRLLQEDREANVPANFYGVVALQGDRVGVDSRKLIGAAVVPDNADAVAGVEEMIVVEQAIAGAGASLRCEIYREEDFSDTVSDSGGPTPPGADGNPDPDPVADLGLENIWVWVSDVVHVKVEITWTPIVMPYPTDTFLIYTRDGGSTWIELGHFTQGPVYIENPELLVEITVRAYTRRLSTGQLSTVAEQTIVPTFNDPSIPEVVQVKFFGNRLEYYPPRNLVAHPRDPHLPNPTAVATSVGLGGLEPGDRQVAYSIVYDWGEGRMSEREPVTTDVTNDRVEVTDIVPTAEPGMRMYKLYMTNAGDPNGVMIHRSEGGFSLPSSDAIHLADSTLSGNDWEPGDMRGELETEVFDAFGVADPTTDPMPLFKRIPFLNSPHRYKRLDCTPIVHSDGAGGFNIKVYIRVVDTAGGASTGVYAENLFASGTSPGGTPDGDPEPPPNSILNQETVQADASGNIGGFFRAQYFATAVDGSTTTEGSTIDDWVPDVYSGVIHLFGCTITGMVPPPQTGGPYGSLFRLINESDNGTFALILKHLDGGSDPTHQFQCQGDVDADTGLVHGAGFWVVYDYIGQRWLVWP